MNLSTDLPEYIDIPAAWKGSQLAQDQDHWSWQLNPAEIQELEQAATHFHNQSLALEQLTVDNFPIPGLQEKISTLRNNLIKGIGFELIRGLPVEHLGEELSSIIFYGLGVHLGSPRSQNAQKDLLGHVRDVGKSSQDPNTRIYQTTERQTFHTDSADVVALLCLKQAQQGGNSLLVSAVTLYNEIRRQQPELLPFLFDNIATDKRGEVSPGEKPYFTIPVFNWHQDLLTAIYQRQYIDSAQRFADAPRLTEQHVAALDLFDRLANDETLYLSMRLQPGDMQFVYNHSLLHDRTGFVDWPAPEERRHLLRLWLAIPEDRALPECFRQRYGDITIGDRGGV